MLFLSSRTHRRCPFVEVHILPNVFADVLDWFQSHLAALCLRSPVAENYTTKKKYHNYLNNSSIGTFMGLYCSEVSVYQTKTTLLIRCALSRLRVKLPTQNVACRNCGITYYWFII